MPLLARAQSHAPVGSELERYLRWLEVAGILSPHQWSLRPFSARELESLAFPLTGHPWAARCQNCVVSSARRERPFHLGTRLLPLAFTSYANTTFPWGFNDGAVWQGKGLSLATTGGLAARWGPLSLAIEPVALYAQNAAFELKPNGFADSMRFGHGQFPANLDAPQRFGERSYARVDPGQSTLRVDLPIVTAGISTANQWWGPAAVNPPILGNNAPGFPHFFVGSSGPLNLWLAKVHGRVVFGDLRQSRFTRNLPPKDRRFMSGLAVVVEPRGLEGLELGASRFFHESWPEGGLSFGNFNKPFVGVLKAQLPPGSDPENPGSEPDNGLGSVWFRWTAPKDGFEIYGEYAKDDHNWDLRDVLGEPENSGGYLLGLRKVWSLSSRGFYGLEIEHLDLRPSQYSLGRGANHFYIHGRQPQGHTHLGQILGSEFGTGGLASTVTLERYHTGGRWKLSWGRGLRQDFEQLAVAEPSDPYARVLRVARLDPEGYDIAHWLGGEVVWFWGPLEISAGVTLIYEFNRYLRDDATNINARLGLRWTPGAAGLMPQRGDELADHSSIGRDTAGTPAGERERLCWNDEWRLPDPSGMEVERCRLDELLGGRGRGSFLLRSPSAMLPELSGSPGRLRVGFLSPRLTLVHNSALPFSLNDGLLWAGVGGNVLVTAGARAVWGPVSLVLAPQVFWSANRPFEMPDPALLPLPLPPDRDSLSSPWHIRPQSIDLPLRFGTEASSGADLGQSTLELSAGPLALGLSSENRWWGPGIRNAIVLSDNAPGFEHFFLRTERPLETRVGELEGIWLVGWLLESRYFDRDPSNDLRSLSALALVWRPRWVSGLSLGFSRAVYAPASGWDEVAAAFFDALISYPGRPNDRPLGDSTQVPGPDQIYSWFGRWVFPRSGLEVYGEFSKTEFPSSLRDFLISPGHTLGYTLGLQWAKPLASGRKLPAVRLQAEHTFLERSSTFRQKPVGTYYTSRSVVQGYTNRGQVLGAAIGPGASSHWLALDYFGERWQVGLFGGRIRWENDALYSVPLPNPFIRHWCMHDVSLFGGIRGQLFGPFGEVFASISAGTRLNLHFRNYSVCGRDFRAEQAVDVKNLNLEFGWVLPSLPGWRLF